jgi:hypothetical protein
MMKKVEPVRLIRSVPPPLLSKLGRYLRVTRSLLDGEEIHVWGQPATSRWWHFVRTMTLHGVEVSKEIEAGKQTPVFIWRLVAAGQNALASALGAVGGGSAPNTEPGPFPVRRFVDEPGLSEVLDVAFAAEQEEGRVLFVLPKRDAPMPWAEIVSGLLLTEGAEGMAKVYLRRRDGVMGYLWRVVLGRSRDPKRIERKKDPKREAKTKVLQPDVIAPKLSEPTKQQLDEATELYRKRWGMVQGPDGTWRVPLDPNGRVTKVVLFNPERVCRVPGIDEARTGIVTVAQLENAGRRPNG